MYANGIIVFFCILLTQYSKLFQSINLFNIILTILLSAFIILNTLWAIRRRWWASQLAPFLSEWKDYKKYIDSKIETYEEVNAANEKRHEQTLGRIEEMVNKMQKAVANQANTFVMHISKADQEKEVAKAKEEALNEWRARIENDIHDIKQRINK